MSTADRGTWFIHEQVVRAARHRKKTQVTMVCCVLQNMCLHTERSMAHITPSLVFPPSLSTSSLLICTPIPSTRPSTGSLQISSSDEIYNCDDPTNVSCGSLADLRSRTEWSSVGEFLDFVSNAQRAPRDNLLRGNAVAMPLREGLRNRAVGHPATFGTQFLHAPSGYAKLFSHTVAMTTSRHSNQVVKGTLGVNNTHNGWAEMDGTVELHDCDCRWEVELNVVGVRKGRNLVRLPIPKLPRPTRILRVLHSSRRLLTPVMHTPFV